MQTFSDAKCTQIKEHRLIHRWYRFHNIKMQHDLSERALARERQGELLYILLIEGVQYTWRK